MSNQEKIKIQFTIWSPKVNNSKRFYLYAKDENEQQIGNISYRLVDQQGIIESTDITTSNPILNQVIEMANSEGFDIDAFCKKYTRNIKRYEANGKLSKSPTEWLEITKNN